MRIYNPPRVTATAVSQTTINVEVLAADKQLTNNDAKIQDLSNPLSTLLALLLPPNPILGKHFLILVSQGSFTINNSIVASGDLYEIIWNGDHWREL